MARTLSQKLIEEKNRQSTAHPWLILLTIVLNDSDSTTYRLVNNNEDVTFEGNEYSKFSFNLEPTKYSSRGDISTLTLEVSNITRLIQPKLEELAGGVGSTVTITVVNHRFLKESYSEFEETFDVLSTKCDTNRVSFILGGVNLLRRRMPLYRYIALHCRWGFDTVADPNIECNYRVDGDGLGKTTCARTLNDCRDRANTGNFGGFVGLKSGGIKIV